MICSDDGKRWNSARSWCSFALGGGCGGGAWSVCKPNFWFAEQEGAVLAPWASFLPMLRASGMLGQRWHHIGLMLSTFRGILWFVLAFVGQELGPHWVYLGPFWAMLGHFGPCWHHIGLMLGHFGLFSDLCRPLFWTWAFQCLWIFVHARRLQKHKNTRKKYNLWTALLMVFAAIFCLFLFLSWGMLQLGYVCLISGLCWAMVGYVGTILGSFWAICLPLLGKSWDHIGLILHHFGLCWAIVGYVGTILGSCWAILVYSVVCICLCWARVGTTLDLSCTILGYVGPLWAMSAPCWAHVEAFWCILWFVLAFVGFWPRWDILGHVCTIFGLCRAILVVFCGLCWPLLGKSWDHIGLILGNFWLVGTFLAPLAPYSAYLEPCWAALEQGRPANRAGGQPAQQQPAQQGHPPGMAEQQGHTLAQQQGHKLGHPSWCRSASTAANKHGGRWAGTAVDTARTPTCLGHLGQQQPVQQGHPPNTAAFATLQQRLIVRHRPNTAAGQPVQQGLAWESSQCSKRGQTRGQASQHSSIWRRTWDGHQACHHSSSNLHLTLYWPGFLSPCGFTNTWQYQ